MASNDTGPLSGFLNDVAKVFSGGGDLLHVITDAANAAGHAAIDAVNGVKNILSYAAAGGGAGQNYVTDSTGNVMSPQPASMSPAEPANTEIRLDTAKNVIKAAEQSLPPQAKEQADRAVNCAKAPVADSDEYFLCTAQCNSGVSANIAQTRSASLGG